MKECCSCRKSLEANASYCYDCTVKAIGQDNMSRYQEMGGWLLFFVIWAVISIIVDFVNAIRGIDMISTLREIVANDATLFIPDAVFNLLTIMTITAFVVIVLSIIFVLQVFNRKSRFLFFYQLAAIFGLLAGILGLIVIGMTEGSTGGGNVVFQLFLAAGGLLLFTLYYSSSVRVRVYMDNDEYFTKAIFTLKEKDEAFITENAERTAPTWQSHVPTASTTGVSAQNTNFVKPSVDTIFCKDCGKSYSCARDTCPYCKTPNAVSTCESCKGRYAATHGFCPHCNHRGDMERLV